MAITSRVELHDHARIYADTLAGEVRAAVAAGEDERDARRRLELAIGRSAASVVRAGGGDVIAFWALWRKETVRTRPRRPRRYGAVLAALLAALATSMRRAA